MIRFKYILLTLGLIFCFGVVAFVPSTSAYTDPAKRACSQTGVSSALCDEINAGDQFDTFVGIIVNTLLFVLGAVSVLAIIIGGIMYTTSGGDAALVTKAKNTLLYAVIGLVVAIMAYAIVNYVIGQFPV